MAIISIRGPVGSWKSSFAASWKPGAKKFWQDLENGAIRALGRIPDWQKEHEIWQPFMDTNDLQAITDRIDANKGDQVQGREKYWNLITSKYVEVVQKSEYPIIIVDTFKEVWDANTQAYLEFVQKAARLKGETRQSIIEIEYATPNTRMRGFLAAGKAYMKDIILISHERPIYETQMNSEGKWISIATDKTELDGFRHTLKQTDWGFTTRIVENCKEEHECPSYHSIITIEKSGMGYDLVGMEFIDMNYTQIAAELAKLGRQLI